MRSVLALVKYAVPQYIILYMQIRKRNNVLQEGKSLVKTENDEENHCKHESL